MLFPLQIPPGVYRNGTDLQSAGRWRDASLVRWIDATIQPVGGWSARATLTDQPLRGGLAWRDLSADRWIAAGTFEGLFVATAGGTATDITPVDFVPGDVSGTVNLGFGGGYYGLGLYGVDRPDIGAISEASTWSMDAWGENLVACCKSDGRLLEWALDVGANAAAISGAPIDCSGLFVTEERFLFAIAPGGNVRKLQWSDREDNTTWTALATNEAGDIELQTAGEIMLGIRTRGQALVLTNTDAHSVTYQGPPFVYGFERVGSSCGAISRLCAASIDAGVFWMGRRGFFAYSGGAVTELPCDVNDYIFSSINTGQASKVAAVVNAKFSEIWWFYPSGESVENNRYVAYNYRENHWAIGEVARTGGVDAGVFANPVWFGADGTLIDHEAGSDFGGAVAFAESGAVQIGTGDNTMAVTQLIPDERTQGDVTAKFKTRFYPNDTEREYGPYSMAAPTDVRFSGRQAALRVEGIGGAWRWGVPRLEIKARGLR